MQPKLLKLFISPEDNVSVALPQQDSIPSQITELSGFDFPPTGILVLMVLVGLCSSYTQNLAANTQVDFTETNPSPESSNTME